MTEDELATELLRRSVLSQTGMGSDFCRTLARLILQYDVKLTLDSFVKQGVLMTDLNNRSVALYPVTTKDGYLRSDMTPYTDILIVETGGIVVGWVARTKVTESEGFAVGTKTLTQMPTEFKFSQPCPHLSEYGGVWHSEEKAWECFGCGEHLPDLMS